jgi:uncharacterized protein (TIGR00255 family)
MILSMTGFGKAVNIFEGKKITFEIRSLNSRQIDLVLKIPSSYKEKESNIRNILINNVLRGKVDAILTIEENNFSAPTKINTSVINSYYQKIRQISEEMGIKMVENPLKLIFTLPNVFSAESNEISEKEWIIVEETINKAIAEFQNFRVKEGRVLEKYLKEKIRNINTLLNDVEQYENQRIERIRNRLIDNWRQLQSSIEFDKNRLEQELFYYIEKIDVSEEKSRLKCHLDYFIQTSDSEENQGKKLGFITQEIGREINTFGSKSLHEQMQKIVVMMKDELEKIKEQILNVL